tara:strand:- start:116 stop:379 length:264 start_codon:yes stop_codon:yes gene_type:complete
MAIGKKKKIGGKIYKPVTFVKTKKIADAYVKTAMSSHKKNEKLFKYGNKLSYKIYKGDADNVYLIYVYHKYTAKFRKEWYNEFGTQL